MLRSLPWAAAALAIAVLSVFTMAGELRASRQVGIGPQPLFGLSHRSAASALERCELHLARPATRVLPTPEWRAALEACRDQARLVLRNWPTDARAWLLVATTSRDLGDEAAFVDALARAQLYAPAVQWLAERRLALADATADTRDYSFDADVLALLESDLGARVLATSWIDGNATRRDRIETAAERAAPALQQRLLDKIRERLAGGPS